MLQPIVACSAKANNQQSASKKALEYALGQARCYALCDHPRRLIEAPVKHDSHAQNATIAH